MSLMALPAAAKTDLQAKKTKAEQDRVAAHNAGVTTVECMAARQKQDCDRMAAFHADTLT